MTNVRCISCYEVKTGTVVVASGLEEVFLSNTIHIKKNPEENTKKGGIRCPWCWSEKGYQVSLWCWCSEGERALISPPAFGQTNSKWSADHGPVKHSQSSGKMARQCNHRVRGNGVRHPLLLLTSVPQKTGSNTTGQCSCIDSIGF